jgi:ABC-type branched-subunit amino acid transport system ATPase component
VPAALGAAISAVIAFISPDVVWATVAGVGGAIALLGSLLRLRLPDAIFGPRATAGIDRTSPDATPTAILCGLCLGPILASVLRFEPYLSRGWQVGPRYLFLTLALGAVLAGATAMSINWYHESHRAVASQEATALAVLAAGALALAAASDTLPGTVIAGAVAAGVACVALTLCAAVSTGAAVAALIAAAATSLAWDGLVRSLDGTSNTLAIAAAPCLVFGITSMLGERSARKVPALTDATPTETASKVGSPAAQPVAAVSPSNPSLAPARSPLLEVRGVTYSYGSVQALFGVDLDVFDGEVTAVVGANGAGKTTFLRTISGLATPSAGSIRFGGRNLAPFAAADRVLLGINQIAAGAAVAEDLTVSENLAMFAHTLPHREARAGRDRALEVFPQLRERLGQRASSMSGGERQILALSKALMLRPRLLIVDELSLGLAPIVVSSLIPIIARLHAEGAAVLLVEQSVSVALDLADVASCMERGRIVYTSSAEELRADTHLLEAAYLEGIAAALEHRGLQV